VILEVLLDLGDDLRIMRTILVQPENGRCIGKARARDGKLNPVPDGCILGLAGAEDVALLDVLFQQYFASAIHDSHHAIAREFEGLVVRAVFLGLLRHQTDVRHRAHGSGI
jgi:hypothetical protein